HERQHRDRRWLLAACSPCRRRLCGVDTKTKYSDRAVDILDVLFAEIGEFDTQIYVGLVTHYGRNTDPARLGQRFQPCRDIDTVSVDVVAINDDVTDVDPNAKRHLAICGYAGVALGHPPLHVNRAANRIDHAWELEQQTVAGRLDDPAAVLRDLGI